MSLRDEFPSHDQSVVFSRIRYSDHEDIDRQISEFIACGGAITTVPAGATANKDAVPLFLNDSNPQDKNDYKTRIEKGKIGAKRNKADVPMFSFPERSKYAQRSKYGMNINKNNNGYFVVIGSARLASGIKTHEEAIEIRDKSRASLGMPAASY